MRYTIRAVLIAATIMSTVAVAAKSADQLNATELTENIYNDCGEHWGIPSPIAQCVLQKVNEYGAELEQTYRRALASAGEDAPLLRESERNWLKYQQTTSARFVKATKLDDLLAHS